MVQFAVQIVVFVWLTVEVIMAFVVFGTALFSAPRQITSALSYDERTKKLHAHRRAVSVQWIYIELLALFFSLLEFVFAQKNVVAAPARFFRMLRMFKLAQRTVLMPSTLTQSIFRSVIFEFPLLVSMPSLHHVQGRLDDVFRTITAAAPKMLTTFCFMLCIYYAFTIVGVSVFSNVRV